ncbi:MAG: peroxidase family protein [Rhodothalassiaceae bacterium]
MSARSIDGTGNNPTNPDWGAAGATLLRTLAPIYADGLGAMISDRGDPRTISNAVIQQRVDTDNRFGTSDLFWAWGQFIDHDLGLTPEDEEEAVAIAIPPGDPFFDPMGSGQATIPFLRSVHEGGSDGQPRQFANVITVFLDASMVYGSDVETAQAVRGEGAFLRVTDAGLLPETDDPHDMDGIIAGDVRAGENVLLLSLHTLFVREHNRQVDALAAQFPGLSDDDLFAAARARVEALVQAITFNEFLPLLLGPGAIGPYQGYDPSINPGLAVDFSTAAFRLGHSLLSTGIERLEEDGTPMAGGPLSLADAFFRPDWLEQPGEMAALLRGTAASPAQDLDTTIVEDVRSFLFGPPGAGGLDLAVLNIQRGRDHGLSSYNDLREALGLARAESFADISTDPAIQARLAAAYADVDLIDVWVGGLAEDPLPGGMLGELFALIVADQFERVRAGDSQWSERILSPAERDALWSTGLADVIARNTEVELMPDKAMIAYARQSGGAGDDAMAGTDSRDFLAGRAGADTLVGGAGDDDMDGGSAGDMLQGGAGTDRARAGSGRDVLIGGAGDDWLSAGSGADTLRGDAGGDRLNGGSGPDLLDGGAGDDRLTGGSGPDQFVLAAGSGSDVITDFTPGSDMLVLAGLQIDPAALLATAQSNADGLVLLLDAASGQTVTLAGLAAADLTVADLLIA